MRFFFLFTSINFACAVAQPSPRPADLVSIDYANVHSLVAEDSDARIVEKAAKLLPRPNQVAWQRQELTFFIHFGPNTFNQVEWGTGKESPSVFNPTALDAKQWVREIKKAGGKMVMLVAKHHDGFCLWPSRYTGHSVAASPWLGGKGDLVRQVSDECKEQGLNFGVYLSPADLFQIHYPDGYYGKNSSSRPSTIPTDPASFASDPLKERTPPAGAPVFHHEVDDYNRYFLNQLYELLTEYGPVHEVWFDGANPHSGSSQTYEREIWFSMIRRLRPEAVIAVKGPDVRWVGNEKGISREQEWSPLPISVEPGSHDWNDMTAKDLGSRSHLKRGSFLTWYPAEADVPLLHGWFWAPSKKARTATELVDIYFASVGRNSNLLLNLSPDKRGLIPANQLAPLGALSQVVAQTFSTNQAAGATITAGVSMEKSPAAMAMDGDLDTWWEPLGGMTTGTLTLRFPTAKSFDVISLQEAIAQRGQRIESLAVDTWEAGEWKQLAAVTTVGHKRLIRLASPITTDRLRVRILQSRLEPTLAEISVHRLAQFVSEPVIQRSNSGLVTLHATAGETIRYTIDGTVPRSHSSLFTGPIDLAKGGIIRAIAYQGNGSHSLEAVRTFGYASAKWTATTSSQNSSHPAGHLIDGDPSTFWQSDASATSPQSLTLDLAANLQIGGFTYLPRQDGSPEGIILRYRCDTSHDGKTWSIATEGEFENIRNNPQEQAVHFREPIRARWLRITSLTDVTGGTSGSAAEISVLSSIK